MKLLHITDSHGTVKSPECRKDVYYITFLKKLYELGYIVKAYGIDAVIHTGDLFHTARVSNKFAGQVSELIKAMGVDFYVVPGNHDIEGYTVDTIDQTMLGLMAKTGVIKLLTRETPMRFLANQDGEEFTVALSGQEYYAHIDEGNAEDFEMQQELCDLNILAIHGYVTNEAQHPDIRCTMTNDIATDADIILSGHYHRQFEWHGADLDIYNPGSMMRVEQTEYNKTHMPHYGILDISLDTNGNVQYDYQFHAFRIAEPSSVVFDYSSKYKQKHASITLDGFKTSLANTMSSMAPSTNIPNIIANLGKTVDATTGNYVFPQEVVNRANQFYNDTLQNLPDTFDVKPGYIPSNKTKKIKRVTLKNFQSHEDTCVDFSEGLNIIVGESNNGKTSILRAIMWAIDNQPLGCDFIMAGKDECKVVVEFDDGTWIERGRTVKDSGYYKIRYLDDNGQLQDATYRGFANAVPVEVDNVHQMPKVSITKDVETHLNVLSQLDAPFLISESPQNKAAAIGRITGTHVIDAAVKEISRQNRNLAITIKNDKAALGQETYALDKLEDAAVVHQASVTYDAILEAMTKLHEKIETLDTLMTDIQSVNNSILRKQDECQQLHIIMQLRPIIDQANASFDLVESTTKIMEQVEAAKVGIKVNELQLRNAMPYKKLAPIVVQAMELCSTVTALDSLTTTIERVTREKERTEGILSFNGEVSNMLMQLVSDINEQINQYTLLEQCYTRVDAARSEADIAEQNLRSMKKHHGAISRQITMKKKERLKFIMSAGYCPCCGQPITEEHFAENVSKFMEENSHES